MRKWYFWTLLLFVSVACSTESGSKRHDAEGALELGENESNAEIYEEDENLDFDGNDENLDFGSSEEVDDRKDNTQREREAVVMEPPKSPAIAPRDADLAVSEAAKNTREFEAHFSSFLAGRAEGAFAVGVAKAAVYPMRDVSSKVVEYLSFRDPVHAMKIEGAWVQIGYQKFMRLQDLQNLGLRTVPSI